MKHEMKECEKCERLTNVDELTNVDDKMVCKECTTVKKIN